MRLFLGSTGLGALPGFLDGAKTVVYVPTAGKPLEDQSFNERNRAALDAMGLTIVELDLDGASDPIDSLGSADAVFVDGGSPFFLLQAIRESGFDRTVTDAVRCGLPYVGMSAGAVVAGPDLEPMSTTSNTSLGPRLRSTVGLGLVDFVVFPHYDSPDRSAEFPDVAARFGSRFELVPLPDDQAVIVDDEGTRIVASELRG